MAKVTVSEKGQVVIPAALREALGIKAGTCLEVEQDGQGLRVSVVRKTRQSSVAKGVGLAGYRGPVIPVEEMDPVRAFEVEE